MGATPTSVGQLRLPLPCVNPLGEFVTHWVSHPLVFSKNQTCAHAEARPSRPALCSAVAGAILPARERRPCRANVCRTRLRRRVHTNLQAQTNPSQVVVCMGWVRYPGAHRMLTRQHSSVGSDQSGLEEAPVTAVSLARPKPGDETIVLSGRAKIRRKSKCARPPHALIRSSWPYIHTCIHTYMHTYMHTYIHTYIHTYMHAYIHTYIYTYIYISYGHIYIY